MTETFASIIERYCAEDRQRGARELKLFAIQKSLASAVHYAGLAESPTGKRFDHQHRVSHAALVESERRLQQNLHSFERAATFHELFVTIEQLIDPIHGIGPLTVYDTALRIGAKLGLEPEFVYLHAGTEVGARHLGVHSDAKWVAVADLPEEFASLRHHDRVEGAKLLGIPPVRVL